MRINKFIALATGMSRRAADQAIDEGRVKVNRRRPPAGVDIRDSDMVTLDGQPLAPQIKYLTIMLDKPVGYVCSRDGQGSRTIYDLLPADLHRLKPVGRLDKDSSGLLLLTNDGELANRLTHPRYGKDKVYDVMLDKPLRNEHKSRLEQGVGLDDGLSRLKVDGVNDRSLKVTMNEGRNRQIRRTFAALGYQVTGLRRVRFGDYGLDELEPNERYRVY